jgi:hypothetical protein
MADPTPDLAKLRRAARQHRYYERHKQTLLEAARESYDPEKRALHYRENRDDIRLAERIRYRCRRADVVRGMLETMRKNGTAAVQKIVSDMLSDEAEHDLTPRDVLTLQTTLKYYPPPEPPVDKCDEAVISLRQ